MVIIQTNSKKIKCKNPNFKYNMLCSLTKFQRILKLFEILLCKNSINFSSPLQRTNGFLVDGSKHVGLALISFHSSNICCARTSGSIATFIDVEFREKDVDN